MWLAICCNYLIYRTSRPSCDSPVSRPDHLSIWSTVCLCPQETEVTKPQHQESHTNMFLSFYEMWPKKRRMTLYHVGLMSNGDKGPTWKMFSKSCSFMQYALGGSAASSSAQCLQRTHWRGPSGRMTSEYSYLHHFFKQTYCEISCDLVPWTYFMNQWDRQKSQLCQMEGRSVTWHWLWLNQRENRTQKDKNPSQIWTFVAVKSETDTWF